MPQPGTALGPPPDSRLVAAGEQYWQDRWDRSLHALAVQAYLRSSGPIPANPGPGARLGFAPEENRTVAYLAAVYSKALNYWGVQLQRNGLLSQAGHRFANALEVNPDNFSADINLICNRNLQAGRSPGVTLTAEQTEKAARLRDIQTVLNQDGPFDEPGACSDMASVFFAFGNYRQAGEEYKRVAEFLPQSLASRLGLAEAMVMRNAPQAALK